MHVCICIECNDICMYKHIFIDFTSQKNPQFYASLIFVEDLKIDSVYSITYLRVKSIFFNIFKTPTQCKLLV